MLPSTLSLFLSLLSPPLAMMLGNLNATSTTLHAKFSTARNLTVRFFPQLGLLLHPRQSSICHEIERIPKPCLSFPTEPQSEEVQPHGQNETPGLKR